MNGNFIALLEEGQFTFQILGNGVTQLGKANYAQKGFYFSSFNAISIGLERIGKLCYLLGFYIHNNLKFPEEELVRKRIGHDLELLYTQSKAIVKRNEIKFQYMDNLDSSTHKNILSILSDFSNGDRYANLNFILKDDYKRDPIKKWFEKVDKPLFEIRVSKRKKEKIKNNAMLAENLLGHLSSIRFISESGQIITSISESSFLTGMLESIQKYRRLVIVQVIRYWVEILWDLQYKAMSKNQKEIPFFSEIFAPFYNDDSYILTRKTF